MSCSRSHRAFLLLVFSLFLFVLSVSASRSCPSRHSLIPADVEVTSVRQYDVELPWNTRKLLEKADPVNASLVLAQERTTRKDPLDHNVLYRGGWNISSRHYYASVISTALPFFITAIVWFVTCGLCLFVICLCACCCPGQSYGYSSAVFTWSRIFLIIFTLAAIAGCILLFTGQAEFFKNVSKTLKYVVGQADSTADKLRDVSNILDSAKGIGVNQVFLPSNIQDNINKVKKDVDSASGILSSETKTNSKNIRHGIKGVGVALIVVSVLMFLLTLVGFILSMLGMQCLIYLTVTLGWLLVTFTFILAGLFLITHYVVGDTCFAMHEWVQNPKAYTAMDDIIPCVDPQTANETFLQSKKVTFQLVAIIDGIITKVANQDLPPSTGQAYYNQNGPMMPILCNPYNPDIIGDRPCMLGEVTLDKAIQVWKEYTCEVSSSGICTTPGRITPAMYSQMASAVNVSNGLYQYSPFLLRVVNCSFIRDIFEHIHQNYCPKLQEFSGLIYIGLTVLSGAIVLSLVLWIVYTREHNFRANTKKVDG